MIRMNRVKNRRKHGSSHSCERCEGGRKKVADSVCMVNRVSRWQQSIIAKPPRYMFHSYATETGSQVCAYISPHAQYGTKKTNET